MGSRRGCKGPAEVKIGEPEDGKVEEVWNVYFYYLFFNGVCKFAVWFYGLRWFSNSRLLQFPFSLCPRLNSPCTCNLWFPCTPPQADLCGLWQNSAFLPYLNEKFLFWNNFKLTRNFPYTWHCLLLLIWSAKSLTCSICDLPWSNKNRGLLTKTFCCCCCLVVKSCLTLLRPHRL